jgi:hypothetical protein
MPKEESAYNKFWRTMGEISTATPISQSARTDRARKRFETMRKEISTVNEFLSDAKKVLDSLESRGADVNRAKALVIGLAKPIQVLNTAMDATAEAVEAAETVSLRLATWYYEAEATCREQASANSDMDNQEMICMAAVVRTWQGRNVKAVLGAQKDSFVSQLWPKWRKRLLLLIV